MRSKVYPGSVGSRPAKNQRRKIMLVPVLLFIVGLLFLIKGGDWFVDGASALARRFHLPELLIGATVVSIGTTLPEVMALFKAHRDAGGVLEIRDRVDELDVFLGLERFLERLYVHTVGVHRDADELRPVGAEVVERADEARRLAQHGLALVQNRFREQIHDLLRAARDKDVVEIAAGAVLLPHIAAQVVAQRHIALGCAVLQREDRVFGHQLCGDLGEGLCREGFRRRVARGERDEAA